MTHNTIINSARRKNVYLLTAASTFHISADYLIFYHVFVYYYFFLIATVMYHLLVSFVRKKTK